MQYTKRFTALVLAMLLAVSLFLLPSCKKTEPEPPTIQTKNLNWPVSVPLPTAEQFVAAGIGDGTVMVDTGDYPVLWHKDSADAGCLSYQLHYVTNDDMIIGDGIAYHCAAVRATATPQSATIYFYPHRINQLTGTTETSGYVAALTVYADTAQNRLYYIGAPTGFKSWAIIKGGRFMLGKNTEEAPGDIYFNFKRRYKS